MPKTSIKEERGFTLIELLLVIAIILILGAILLFAINPAEQLKKARDSQRISDLSTIATSLNLYLSDVTTADMGSVTTTYFSYISASAVCGATPPAFLDFQNSVDTVRACPASVSAAASTSGTGWIPVDLSDISSGSPIAAFPVDPVGAGCAADATTAGTCDTYFYRFTSGPTATTNETKYVMDAVMESTSNKDRCTDDGGQLADAYEVGNDFEPDGTASTQNGRDFDGGCAA